MTIAKPIRVLCVDNHPLVCKGVAFILANQEDMRLVGEAHRGRQAVEAFLTLSPDVTLMDLRMPDLDGIEATKRSIGHAPDAKVIALTTYGGDQEIYRALAAGVRGYILKETLHAEVLQAIRTVHSASGLYSPLSLSDLASTCHKSYSPSGKSRSSSSSERVLAIKKSEEH